MLRYVAYGIKDFQEEPVPPCTRLNWEFYAVTKGTCAPCVTGSPESPLQNETLWLMPPQLVYGWRTGQRTIYRYCFQFPIVPKEVQKYLEEQKYLSVKLSPEDVRQIARIAEETLAQFKTPNSCSHLYYEKALLELCLLILREIPEKKKIINMERLAEERTASAVAWFSGHMERNPTVEEVASALHMTGTHLRRMTLRARGQTPHQIFRELQIKRSLDILSTTMDTLEEVGKKCGFKRASHFAKAFHQEMGVAPNKWRTKCRIH